MNRHRLFLRGSTYYRQDSVTGQQLSLRTKDRETAERLIHAFNEAHRMPEVNLQIAKAYLTASDPAMKERTWLYVMEEMGKLKKGPTKERWEYAIKDPALQPLHPRKLLETRAEHLLQALREGTVSTNVFLRRMHNFAVDMNWLPWPVLPKRQWPAVEHRSRRAITREEHERILAREHNPELNAFYALMWHLGGSQSDIASLRAEDVDWNDRCIIYRRRKTGQRSVLHFGDAVAAILKERPIFGLLFPRVSETHERHRAKLFHRRCQWLGIKGVSLHSYRYAWAERALVAGMPERFAQEALGHSSKAVHRAYSKKAEVKVPSLEEYEASALRKAVVELPMSNRC